MTAEQLRALQTPLKERYRDDPGAALVTMVASGRLTSGPVCHVERSHPGVPAGLHPAAGGDGSEACSGEMMLEALVACAGVTLGAVATAMGIEVRGGTVRAEGDMDFRGTLGVDKTVPVGLTAVRLSFELDTDASADQLATLLKLTERYCVVYQTLKNSVSETSSVAGCV